MSRRRKRTDHANHERWLVSYADFITLLFGVFVVLYAASQTDHRRVGKLALAIQVAFQDLGIFQASTTQPPLSDSDPMPFSKAQIITNIDRNTALGRISPDPENSRDDSIHSEDTTAVKRMLSKVLEREIANKQATLREGPDGLILSLNELGFFTPGSDTLSTSTIEKLERVVTVLKPSKFHIRIEGNTDNVPIHNPHFDSNWELSTARATGLVRLFVERYQFSPERLSAAGYGEFHPVDTNETSEGRSMNRRVDFVITAPPKPVLAQSGKPQPALPPLPSVAGAIPAVVDTQASSRRP